MNKLNNIQNLVKDFTLVSKLLVLVCVFLFSESTHSQNNVERYNIGEIEVSGNTSFSPLTIITFSGLRHGQVLLCILSKLCNQNSCNQTARLFRPKCALGLAGQLQSVLSNQ